MKKGILYIIENAVIFTFAAKPKKSEDLENIKLLLDSKSLKNGEYIYANSIIK